VAGVEFNRLQFMVPLRRHARGMHEIKRVTDTLCDRAVLAGFVT
jgi:hypothetical protein